MAVVVVVVCVDILLLVITAVVSDFGNDEVASLHPLFHVFSQCLINRIFCFQETDYNKVMIDSW